MKMIKGLFSLALSMSLLITTASAQSNWKVDKAHAKVTFSTVHNTIADVQGLFNGFDAEIAAAKTDFSDAVFTLTIDVKSIDTEVEMRDNHLRSADFFHVEEFPQITFKSTSIQSGGKNGHYKLKGDLTIKDVTKQVTMDMWYRGTIENDKKKKIAGFQITGTLNRLDFGVGTNFPASLISNEVTIKADGEFIQE